MSSALRPPALLAAAALAASALACASAPPSAPPADPAASAPAIAAVPFDLETMTAPRPLHVPQPEYTPTARRLRWQGRIASEVLIDEEGRVREVRLLQPAPYGLGESIRRTQARWRFEPALLEGQPVAVWYRLETSFGITVHY